MSVHIHIHVIEYNCGTVHKTVQTQTENSSDNLSDNNHSSDNCLLEGKGQTIGRLLFVRSRSRRFECHSRPIRAAYNNHQHHHHHHHHHHHVRLLKE